MHALIVSLHDPVCILVCLHSLHVVVLSLEATAVFVTTATGPFTGRVDDTTEIVLGAVLGIGLFSGAFALFIWFLRWYVYIGLKCVLLTVCINHCTSTTFLIKAFHPQQSFFFF